MKRNFFMMPNEVFNLMLKPQELAVLSYLVKCTDKSGTCYPSVHTIAEACRMSDNTARKCTAALCDRKIISKAGGFCVGKFGKIQPAPYVYSLNPSFFDSGFATNNLVEFYSENAPRSSDK